MLLLASDAWQHDGSQSCNPIEETYFKIGYISSGEKQKDLAQNHNCFQFEIQLDFPIRIEIVSIRISGIFLKL